MRDGARADCEYPCIVVGSLVRIDPKAMDVRSRRRWGHVTFQVESLEAREADDGAEWATLRPMADSWPERGLGATVVGVAGGTCIWPERMLQLVQP